MSNLAADNTFASRLLDWHASNGRKGLPWQTDATPYRVWVSEIMLQQTQVGTVIPYFAAFMKKFPDILSLATAHEDEVLHLWSGLGYYARARNLHAAAKLVKEQHDGELPVFLDQLVQLPGIGRSTAGAILALSHGKRFAILDGNTKRVLARYHEIDGWPGKADTLGKLWALAELHLPDRQLRRYTQAIMDLGATVCRRQPDCPNCPVACGCKARTSRRQLACPGKKPAVHRKHKEIVMLIARQADGSVYLERRPPSGVWGGLWSFPEIGQAGEASKWCGQKLSCRADRVRELGKIRHALTHFEMTIYPVLVDVSPQGVADQDMDSADRVWYNDGASRPIGLAAPVSRLMKRYANTREAG